MGLSTKQTKGYRDYLFMGSLKYNDGHCHVWKQPNYYDMAHGERIRNMIDSFSCHLRWQELKAIAKDKSTLKREEGILARETWNFYDRPTYYTAIRNLQGFIAYNLQKPVEAQDFFEDVLDKDQNNVNALANLAHMFQELGKLDHHHRYVDKLAVILGGKNYEEKARAYADKAHAIRYFEQFKRCFRYMRYIQRAAVIGKHCAGPQRAEWFFDFALALYRRDVQMLYLRKLSSSEENELLDNSDCYSDTKIKEGFLNACNYFKQVAMISTSRDYQALSWVFLGILVNHDPEHRSLAEVFPEKPEYRLTPDQCFEKGLGIHPEHEIVLRRVGSEYVKLKRFEEAKQLLDKSLNILQSRFGYRYRADMYLKMYEAASVKDEQTKELLRNAVADLEKALKFKEVHADFSDLGYAYFLLGETNQALNKFVQAVRCDQDDFFDPVLTHQRWAECLEKDNQPEGSRAELEKAKEIRKRVLDTPLEEDQCDSYFAHDFEHYNTNPKPGFVRILMDYHFWSACSKRRLSELSSPGPTNGRHAYQFDLFVWHTEENSRWAVAFVHKLESEHKLRCCIERRDFMVGREVPGNILDCLKLSYRCVIVLPGGKWTKYTINQALGVSNTREGLFILPIKVRECPVPEELGYMTVRECEEGQVKQEHWDEIVTICRQT
ncbi:uncharacterized protein LOC117299825 [Asterias rubens]|uniref:uncharacterized protein LOC117299825 n=1 Tax=Asterias rubens TaxID=7604 RepID=UPI0014552E75|nr:uncharacterized protein LOC117299825 [Asterias rubens]